MRWRPELGDELKQEGPERRAAAYLLLGDDAFCLIDRVRLLTLAARRLPFNSSVVRRASLKSARSRSAASLSYVSSPRAPCRVSENAQNPRKTP